MREAMFCLLYGKEYARNDNQFHHSYFRDFQQRMQFANQKSATHQVRETPAFY